MVKLLHTLDGIFIGLKNPTINELGHGSFRDDFEKDIIESLRTSGDFIKKYHLKFGLRVRPPQPLVVFGINYFANPYEWLIMTPTPYNPTDETVSSVVHETAHCLH